MLTLFFGKHHILIVYSFYYILYVHPLYFLNNYDYSGRLYVLWSNSTVIIAVINICDIVLKYYKHIEEQKDV